MIDTPVAVSIYCHGVRNRDQPRKQQGPLGGRTVMAPDREGKLIGQQLGDYLLEGLLGSGGMAEVYRARELALGREVAVKVLPASLAHDRSYVERSRTEA